jgi:hypothetical protein
MPASPTAGLNVTWTQIAGLPVDPVQVGPSVEFVLPSQEIPSFAGENVPLEPEVMFRLTVQDPRSGAQATDTIQVVRELRILVAERSMVDA